MRVVYPNGDTKVVATQQAVREAKDIGLDLVLVAPNAQPPVAKIIDYGEYSYQEKKRKHEAKKKQHRIEVKEVKFRPNTDDHDYNFKKNHAVRFLEEGNKVKGTVFFRGREITHPQIGRDLLMKLAKDVADIGDIEVQPRMEGKTIHLILTPKKRKQERQQEKQPAQQAKPAPKPAAEAPAQQDNARPQPAMPAS